MSEETPFKRSAGRPRKRPEEKADYGKPKPAPRIEGEPYVDRTGRPNPGAFVKGNTAGVGKPGSVIPKAVREICKGYGPACIETVFALVQDPEVAARDRINGAKVILGYGEGLPRAEIGLDANPSSGWASILDKIAAEKASVTILPAEPIDTAKLVSDALAQVVTESALSPLRDRDESDDKE